MIIVAKLALGLASTMVFATVYTFREGVIRVDVDEHHEGGSHVHVWVPAAAVPMAMHFVPKEHLREASSKASEYMPLVKIVTAELRRYPDTTFVEVQDGKDHVRVATAGGKLQIDVVSDEENVHVAVPLSTVDDVARQLEADAPGI
jgi:hypothetical protein